jgi:hypothetical protein
VGGNGNDSRFVVTGRGLLAAEDAGDEFADHVVPFRERIARCEKPEFYRKVMIFQPISLLCRCSVWSGSTATGVVTLPMSGRSLCESL